MKLKIHSQIGKYARPLNIRFNGMNKTISTYDNTVEFEFEEANEYDLCVEQAEEEKPGFISHIILIIINCFDVMLSLSVLDSFNFADYNDTRPYSLKNNYCIKLNSDTDIFLDYRDSSFSSAKSEFSVPCVKIKGCNIMDEKIKLDCSVESVKQNEKYLKITLSLICFIGFLLISLVCYSAVLSKSILPVCLCSIILLFIVAGYIVALRKIKITYNKIVQKLKNE